MAELFFSYARADDESFVKQLSHDLTEGGFDVWWDRQAMESRGRSFLQEIRDGISAVNRLILVIGPQAAQSDYVRVEWQFALEMCKIIIPILRLGDFALIPSELSKLHCPDFRKPRPYKDALTELLRILSKPAPPLAALNGVDALPPHFLPRPEEVERLKQSVLTDVSQPTVITSAKQTTALQGMGGVGKTVLAVAFARACEIRRAFINGIICVKLGQQPDLAASLRFVGMALDDDNPQFYFDLQCSQERLAQLLKNKTCLLVLDDAWDVSHIEAFVNVLGTRCRLLITTRDGGLATAVGAQDLRMDALNKRQAIGLLAQWAAQSEEMLPAEAHEVARECGNLPFALSLCGAMAREGTPWADLLDALSAADLTFIERKLPNYQFTDVLRSLKVSVDALARTDPTAVQHYLELGVFPPGEAVPEAAILTLWLHSNSLDERGARKLLTTMERKALLRLAGEAPQRRISLHDLQHDYLRAAQSNLNELHAVLLTAYHSKCKASWPSGPNDGYFFQHLSNHLVAAGRKKELRKILFDLNWLQAKLEATDINAVIADYGLLLGDTDLRQIKAAIQLSAQSLSQDKKQLAGQLLGRLLSQETSSIKELLKHARKWKAAAPWLRPLKLCLTPPGGSLLHILTGHGGWVRGLAVTPDSRRAVSASQDSTLKVWDLSTEKELFTLRGHTDEVWAVAVTPGGRRAISASDDHTLKVWNIEKGTELLTLRGHTAEVKAVAVLPDGRRGVSASWDGTLRIWDLEEGKQLRVLRGHTEPVDNVFVTSDGQSAISYSWDQTLKVWDLEREAKWGPIDFLATAIARAYFGLQSDAPDGRLSDAFENFLEIVGFCFRPFFLAACRHLERKAVLRTIRISKESDDLQEVAITPDGRRAISSLGKVWDLERGVELNTLHSEKSELKKVVIMPDGQRVLTVSYDRTLTVWDIQSGKSLFKLQGLDQELMVVAVTPDGQRAISGSTDNALRIWTIESVKEESTKEQPTLRDHAREVIGLALMPDGQRAVSVSRDNTIKIWDLASGAKLRTLRDHNTTIHYVAITPDGRLAVSSSHDGVLKVWDLVRGKILYELDGSRSKLFDTSVYHFNPKGVWVTPDGKYAMSGGRSMWKVWDLERGTDLWTPQKKHWKDSVTLKALTPDGRRALWTSLDNHTITVCDFDGVARHSLQYRTLRGHTDFVTAMAITPDSKRVVSASADTTLKVWSLENGKEERTLRGHTDKVRSVIVMPNGGRALSASEDSTLKLWDLEHGEELLTLYGHTSMATAMAVTPDGRWAVSASKDATLKLWNLNSGEIVANFYVDTIIECCAIAPDGITVVAGDRHGAIHILYLEGT